MLRYFASALAMWVFFIPFGMITQHMSFGSAFQVGMVVAGLIIIAPFCKNLNG